MKEIHFHVAIKGGGSYYNFRNVYPTDRKCSMENVKTISTIYGKEIPSI